MIRRHRHDFRMEVLGPGPRDLMLDRYRPEYENGRTNRGGTCIRCGGGPCHSKRPGPLICSDCRAADPTYVKMVSPELEEAR